MKPTSRKPKFDLFDISMSAPMEDATFHFHGHAAIPWADFWLNPRRLRGSDFLMRWSQGKWSEDRIIDMVNASAEFYALPYGLSATAPEDPKEYEEYWIRLDEAGLSDIKRPDILIFRSEDIKVVQATIESLGGIEELPFKSESDSRMKELLSLSILAVESENSLWKAAQMPDYNAVLRPQRRLGGKLGLRKKPVLPTVIVKEEDRGRLFAWQESNGLKIHVWQVFFDLAFGIALDDVQRLVDSGLIEGTVQTYQAANGATTNKTVYFVYHHYAYRLGVATEEPELVAASITDANGHILPYVKFHGGSLGITEEALEVLRNLK